jgi:hypothetical protein
VVASSELRAHGDAAAVNCEEGSACPHAATSPNRNGDEDASLLQHARSSQRKLWAGAASVGDADTDEVPPGVVTSGNRSIAIAFQGGGFLSLGDFTGLFVGLLHGMYKMGEKGGLARMFQKFGMTTGISGGAWFLLLLTYSKSFSGLLDHGALDPNSAGTPVKEFFVRVLNPFKDTSLNGTADGIAQCIEKVLKPIFEDQAASGTPSLLGKQAKQGSSNSSSKVAFDLEMLAEAIILLQSGQISWLDLVQTMLHRGGGIDPALPFGTDQYNNWAEGKLMLTGVSLATPAGQDMDGKGFSLPEVVLYGSELGDTPFTYGAEANSSKSIDSQILPAALSIIVGNGEDQQSVTPFCSASPSICEKYAPSYKFEGKALAGNAEVSFNERWKSAFEQSAGKISVSGLAASSSAFKGYFAISSKNLDGHQDCVDLATWTTMDPNGKGYVQAKELQKKMFTQKMDEAVAAEAASAGLQPLLDGGMADNYGLSNSLVAGATEILSIQDINAQGAGNTNFFQYFAGAGGSNPSTTNIFRTPTYEQVVYNYTNVFKRIKAPSSATFFDAIAYGTLICETMDQPWLGITAGRTVTIHVIAVETKQMTIGLTEKGYAYDGFFDYGTLVGEMARAMAMSEHQEAVQGLLQSFFL